MYVGAGILLRNSKNQILLVCDRVSSKWGFPKGHPEICDNKVPFNTAIRECFEETGLVLNEDYVIDNPAPKRIGKRIYFQARSVKEQLEKTKIDRNEIRDIAWWSFEDFKGRDDMLNSDLRCWIKKRAAQKSPGMGPTSIGSVTVSSLAI